MGALCMCPETFLMLSFFKHSKTEPWEWTGPSGNLDQVKEWAIMSFFPSVSHCPNLKFSSTRFYINLPIIIENSWAFLCGIFLHQWPAASGRLFWRDCGPWVSPSAGTNVGSLWCLNAAHFFQSAAGFLGSRQASLPSRKQMFAKWHWCKVKHGSSLCVPCCILI